MALTPEAAGGIMQPEKQSEREANDLKKAMLLLAMLAMVLAAVAPAYAQQGNQLAARGGGGDLIQQCQNNLNQNAAAAAEVNQVNLNDGGNVTGDQGNAQVNEGAAVATAANINTGDLVNNCMQIVNNT